MLQIFYICVKFDAMISILIPERNYDCRQLVRDLVEQCATAAVKYEIIVMDDNSSLFVEENRQINQLPNCTLVEQHQHLGAAKARNTLANMAKYPFLLLMDCDAGVTSPDYIQRYLDHIGQAEVIIGGLSYNATPPDKEHMLRWKYGRNRECIPAEVRNQHPYRSLLSFQLLIRKDILMRHPFEETVKDYGHEDTILGYTFKKQGVSVLHIDNTLEHMGLDTNDVFLQKSLMAARKYLSNPVFKDTTLANEVKLFRVYRTIRRWGLQPVLRLSFRLFRPLMKHHLLSGRPSLFIFDMYRLGYLCLVNKFEKRA